MFINMMIYQMKRMLRSKENLFWSLGFPIILGTLFFLAFGNMLESEKMQPVPIAIVEANKQDDNLVAVLEELAKEGDNQLLKIQKKDEKEAKKLLANETINAYVIAGEEPELIVKKSGMQQSVVKEILEEYKRTKTVVMDLMKRPDARPDQMASIAEDITNSSSYIKEVKLGSGEQDTMLNFFYALMGMTLIYAALWGVITMQQIEGNLSALGARRMVAPVSKFKMISADLLGTWIVNICEVMIVLLYLVKVLDVNFGDNFIYIIPVCVLGSAIGISLGAFLASLFKGSENSKIALTVGVCMVFSTCSGLMSEALPRLIEKACPVAGYINPCSVVMNCFYSLTVFDSKQRYGNYLAILGIMVFVLLIGCSLLMRRRKYASL